MRARSICLCVMVAALVGMTQVAVGDILVNGDFEQCTSGYGDFTTPYGTIPTNAETGWTLGESIPASHLLVTTLYKDHQNEVDFGTRAQGDYSVGLSQLGTVSQTVNGFVDGTLTVSFLAQGRPSSSGGDGANPLKVMLDGTALTFGGSDTITPLTSAMTSYVTDSITVTAGSHTLLFQTTVPYSGAGTDLTTVIDNVALGGTSTIPEPTGLVMIAIGLVSLLAYAWKKRRS